MFVLPFDIVLMSCTYFRSAFICNCQGVKHIFYRKILLHQVIDLYGIEFPITALARTSRFINFLSSSLYEHLGVSFKCEEAPPFASSNIGLWGPFFNDIDNVVVHGLYDHHFSALPHGKVFSSNGGILFREDELKAEELEDINIVCYNYKTSLWYKLLDRKIINRQNKFHKSLFKKKFYLWFLLRILTKRDCTKWYTKLLKLG